VVLGIALFFGRSSTQLADFIRRTVELAAIVVSWIVFRMLYGEGAGAPDPRRQKRLERTASVTVGVAMCLSGLVMLFIALSTSRTDKGNVIPGLIIAFLGVVVNSWFWFRYRMLNREKPDGILETQSGLYRAKSVVDTCVVLALSFVAIAPNAPATHYVDLGGTIVVAVYLMRSGLMTIRRRGVATD
jgi:divalent metal cation (Fe/Co/Zn/Cd) transporter